MTTRSAAGSVSYIRDLCYSAVFAAVIAVMAQLSIPLPGGVPLTLQTLGIMLAGIVLGPRRGTLSVLIYILLGAIGLPVFAGFKGGLSSVIGPTGGFIISFWVVSLCAGLGFSLGKHFTANSNCSDIEDTEKRSIDAISNSASDSTSFSAFRPMLILLTLIGILAGVVLNYVVGVVWFSSLTGNSMSAAMSMCVLPFVVTDTIKIIIAVILGPVLNAALARNGLL